MDTRVTPLFLYAMRYRRQAHEATLSMANDKQPKAMDFFFLGLIIHVILAPSVCIMTSNVLTFSSVQAFSFLKAKFLYISDVYKLWTLNNNLSMHFSRQKKDNIYFKSNLSVGKECVIMVKIHHTATSKQSSVYINNVLDQSCSQDHSIVKRTKDHP